MKFFLHPQAQEELEQTILLYKQQQAGLEKRFIEAVDDAIIFRTKSAQLEIIAIMHLRKQPNYWQAPK
ncbi:MAG: hypothetical protein ACXV9R_09100 [Methylobacter sp.]